MKIAKLLFWMVFGYLVAVLVATIVTVALMLTVSVLPDQGTLGSFYRLIKDVIGIAYVGAIITASYAFPGWLISVLVAVWRSERRRGYFVIAGALTALLAHFIMALISSSGSMASLTGGMGAIYLWSMIGGLCGGWAYWRVAIVRFGKWRVEA